MSKKRTAAESNGNDPPNPTNVQREDNAKRAKLDLLSDTTLQDLPIEIIESILVKSIVSEMNDLHLSRKVWTRKVDELIMRLGDVCSQWSSICATDFFRKEIQRILDDIAQTTIRLAVLQEFILDLRVDVVFAVNGEIFMLCKHYYNDYHIHVYDRNNMAEVKDVIRLEDGHQPLDVVSCHITRRVYFLYAEALSCYVVKLVRDRYGSRTASVWLSDLSRSALSIFSGVSGNVLLLENIQESRRLSVYDVNGSLRHRVALSREMCGWNVISFFQRANGNIVVNCTHGRHSKVQLTEIDTSGTVIRMFHSGLGAEAFVNCADSRGRTLVNSWNDAMELLDSEFNPQEFSCPPANEMVSLQGYKVYYDGEYDELMHLITNRKTILTIFKFIEE